MAHNPKTSLASRNLALDAAFDVLDGGGFMRWYDGTQPTDANTALGAQVKLAELPLSSDSFQAASNGSKVANAITSAAILASGTATWGTLVKSDGVTRVQDFSIGTSGADLTLNAVVLAAGATAACNSWTETMAA